MQALRTALDGKRSEPFTVQELRQAVQECAAAKTLIERAKLHLYIVKGLARKLIEPDVLLTIAIAEVKGIGDLIMVALALRGGANRNLYVQTPNIGYAHIIVYAATTLRGASRETNLIILTLLVLLIMGSQTSAAAFDQSYLLQQGEFTNSPGANTWTPQESKAPATDTSFLENVAELFVGKTEPLRTPGVTPKPVQSVQDWLKAQGLPAFDQNIDKLVGQLRREVRVSLGTMCDRPDLAYTEDTVPALEDVLASRATQIINQYPADKGTRVAILERGEPAGISRSVEAIFAEAFIHFLDAGLPISYFTVNRLVLGLRTAFRAGDTTITTEFQMMLQYAIDRGTPLDYEQLAVISTTNAGLAQQILQVYRQPQWKKACAGPASTPTPDALKITAFTIGIDPSTPKTKICEELKTLSQADAISLKNAAILRQKARVGANVSSISDFIAGSVPAVSCSNNTVMQTDPFDYNDASMTFYKDSEAQIWCFTSDMYQSLLNNPINPHTGQALPTGFKLQLQTHLDILQRLGIPPSNPIPVTTAIDALTRPDEVSGKESTYIIDTVTQAAKVAGIDVKRIATLTPAQMNQVLATINMDRPELLFVDAQNRSVMTPEHRLATFARAAYFIIKEQPEQARIFYTAVKLLP